MFATRPRPTARDRRIRPALEAMEGRQLLTYFGMITSAADSGPGTLRAAILNAEAQGGPGLIYTNLPGGTGTITLQSPLPDLTGNLSIHGPVSGGLTITRTGAPFRIFTVDSGATVNLARMTISGGQVQTYQPPTGPAAEAEGGGILNSGTLVLSSAVVTGCLAEGPTAAAGGGIYNAGTLDMVSSTVSGDSASVDGDFGGYGGGIYNAETGSLTITNSSITGNTACGEGGGLWAGGVTQITSSTIDGNRVHSDLGMGGGIYFPGSGAASLSVASSTISRNGSEYGAAIFDSTYGLYPSGGPLVAVSLISCTVADNNGWEAIVGTGATMSIAASTIAANIGVGVYDIAQSPYGGASIALADSIVAGNGTDVSGPVLSLGHNLIGNASGVGGLTSTDRANVDPLLAPLGHYGGALETMALLPGSPAIDAGSVTNLLVPGGTVAVDERGVSHSGFGAAADIGAFESRGFTIQAIFGNGGSTPIGQAFAIPLIVQVTSSYGEPVDGGKVTFTAPTSGPSANLYGSGRTATCTIANGGFASIAAYADAIAGSYVVTATAAGITVPAQFQLKNDLSPV